MRVWGITGGIGSGKSTVAGIIRELGIPVFDADQHVQLAWGLPTMQSQIATYFGLETPLDLARRKIISDIVFNDPIKRSWLQAKIHPFVLDMFGVWKTVLEGHGCQLVMIDAPLIFETNMDKGLDGTIAVLASEDLRILRVKVRSGLSEQQIRERMTSQVTDYVRKARATYIIENEGTLETVRERTKAVLNRVR